MRIKPSLLSLLLSLSLHFPAYSQSKKEENKRIEAEIDQCDVEALKLIKKAGKLWKDDAFAEAEKLYYAANKLCPTSSGMIELANNKMEMGDIKGANKTWDVYIHALETMKPMGLVKQKQIDERLGEALNFKIGQNIKMGSPREAIRSCFYSLEHPPPGNLFPKTLMQKAHFTGQYFQQAAELAFQLEDRESLEKFSVLLKPVPNNDGPLFYTTLYLNLLEGKYDEALAAVKKVAEDGADFPMAKGLAKSLIPLVYSYKGDWQQSEAEMAKIAKNSIVAGKNWSPVISGMNAFLKKDYKTAIAEFTKTLSPRGLLNIEEPGKFVNYKRIGECYEKTGDVKNAKKKYEAALLYEPDYEPALQGLARLEGRINVNVRKDKTPPEIIVTEPTGATKGIGITTADSIVMIKGIALDSFGIKSVTINGNPVYLKEEGDFWAGITVSNGTNRITIEATDLAGNKATKSVEINKSPVEKKNEDVPVTDIESRNFAFLIASQQYDDPAIPQLENPITDAVKLKLLLKNSYGFKEENIFTSYNPEVPDTRKQFQALTEQLKPQDNLVIFYAGHGIWDKQEKKGYWLLTDARRFDKSTWLTNKEVLEMIAKVPSRHTLLITDACFSGGVFRTRGLGDAPPAISKLNEKISRVAITSGNDTEVPDESVFMKYLVKALAENKEKYITAQKMFINQILEAVMTETKTEPRYGTLELAGHVGGDFIFIKK